jgi:hypothetical protein
MVDEFQNFKLALVQVLGLSRDALHVYVGVSVFLITALLSGRSMRARWPMIAVVLAACAGELLDAISDVSSRGHWRVGASVRDLVNTVAVPILLFLLARYARLGR